jgi:4-hydroxy-2-oxoheptanedioate aldolase
MLRTNATLRLLRAYEPAIGTWLQLHSVHAARLLAAQGFFRWMLVDFEHTPVDNLTATHLFSTISDISAGEITPLARVAVGSVEAIKQKLDCGAQGVIAPMINTAGEAADVVRFARFPRLGERGAGGLHPHLGFGVSRPEYIAAANAEILVGIQIETVEAVRRINEILDVPGIDLIFLGPNDLHISLGLPAMFWSDYPTCLAAVRAVKSACTRKAVPLGTLCRDAPAVRQRIDDSFAFVGMGSDVHFMLTFAGQQYGELYGVDEPPETWCNAINLGRLNDSLRGRPLASVATLPVPPRSAQTAIAD